MDILLIISNIFVKDKMIYWYPCTPLISNIRVIDKTIYQFSLKICKSDTYIYHRNWIKLHGVADLCSVSMDIHVGNMPIQNERKKQKMC